MAYMLLFSHEISDLYNHLCAAEAYARGLITPSRDDVKIAAFKASKRLFFPGILEAYQQLEVLESYAREIIVSFKEDAEIAVFKASEHLSRDVSVEIGAQFQRPSMVHLTPTIV